MADTESLFDHLSHIQSLLSEIKLLSADTAPYKENDSKKYYKLTCNIMFHTYYKYVAIGGDRELKSEIEKFGNEISEDDLRKIESVEVTVKDCLQDFLDHYEKKIQKWYFRSNWDASQGKNAKMDEMFEEVRNSPVFHTYSALRKWEQFEKYREKLLISCRRADASVREYQIFLDRLEKAPDIEEEYRNIRNELDRRIDEDSTQPFHVAIRGRTRKKSLSDCSYEINEDKLKFLFWEPEYYEKFAGMPVEVACVLTDTKLNVIERWQYIKNVTAAQEFAGKMKEVLKENYVMIFGYDEDFLSVKYFLDSGTYMKCDIGALYEQVVGRPVSVDKMSELVCEDANHDGTSSMSDINQILSIFKALCSLRGESPCDMIRFFQMELNGK